MDENSVPEKLIDKLRAKENTEENKTFLAEMDAASAAFAEKLAEHFGDPEVMATGPSGWRWKLMEHITEAAGDLDIDVSKWMSGSTPLGVEEPIEPRGIFPPCGPTQAQEAAAAYLQQRVKLPHCARTCSNPGQSRS